MIQLSAFADEIARDVEGQLVALKRANIHAVDLRAAWGIPVLQLDDAQASRLETLLAADGVRIAAIATPIGKTPIDAPFYQEIDRLERAILLARRLNAPYIRIFSFYPPRTGAPDGPQSYRREVIDRLRELTARARAASVILVHENEKEIYGDTAARCVDLLETIDDPHFRAAFDPANFIQCAETAFPDAYQSLLPWISYVHVKDARSDGTVVAAGEGEARWPDLLGHLRDQGYDGTFALEPHLAAAGQFSGFSGPALFDYAANAFQALLKRADWSFT